MRVCVSVCRTPSYRLIADVMYCGFLGMQHCNAALTVKNLRRFYYNSIHNSQFTAARSSCLVLRCDVMRCALLSTCAANLRGLHCVNAFISCKNTYTYMPACGFVQKLRNYANLLCGNAKTCCLIPQSSAFYS